MKTDFYTTRDHVARKQHKCIWCSEVIEKGTEHINAVGVFHGDLYREFGGEG